MGMFVRRKPIPLSGLGRVVAGSLLASPLAAPAEAVAQTYEPILDTEYPLAIPSVRNKTVVERPHPELDPQGLGAGGFRLFPELSIAPGYSSNPLGSSANGRQDILVTLSPKIRADSQWGRHALTVTADYMGKRYASVSARNEDGFHVGADGRLDIRGESNLAASAAYERVFEQQYTGSFPANGGASIAVRHPSATMRATFAFNRLRLVASADYDRFNYSDTVALNGARLDQSFRDRTVYRINGRGEYLFAADSVAFLQATYRRAIYDNRSNGLTDRTSTEYRLVAGIVTDVTPIIRTAIGIGYAERRYDQAALRPVRNLAADVRIDYNVTPLTTFSWVGRRSIEEATIPNATSYVATKLGFRVDHELLRNLLLNASVDHERDQFKGIARHDRFFRVGAGAAYTMSRNVVLTPGLDYLRRTSNGVSAGPSFKEVRFVLRATFRI